MNIFVTLLVVIVLLRCCWLGYVKDRCERYMCMYRMLETETNYSTENIDGLKCTHIHMCYFLYYYNALKITVGKYEVYNSSKVQHIFKLKTRYRHLKLFASFQVSGENVFQFGVNKTKYDMFLQDVVEFTRKNGFNGLSIRIMDLGEGIFLEKQTVTFMLRDLQSGLEKESMRSSLPRLLLVHIASSRKRATESSYKIDIIHNYVDYTILAAMDFTDLGESSWSIMVHNAPLKGHHNTTGNDVMTAVKEWLLQKHPRHKLVLGLPFYGLGFERTDEENPDMGFPLDRYDVASVYGARNRVTYKEVCHISHFLSMKVEFDENYSTPYIYYRDIWMSFENQESLQAKITFALETELNSLAMFYVNDDDETGNDCGVPPYPLTRAVYLSCIDMRTFGPLVLVLIPVVRGNTDPTKLCAPDLVQFYSYNIESDMTVMVVMDFKKKLVGSVTTNLTIVQDLVGKKTYVTDTSGNCESSDLPPSSQYFQCLPASSVSLGTIYLGLSPNNLPVEGWVTPFAGGTLKTALSTLPDGTVFPVLTRFVDGNGAVISSFFVDVTTNVTYLDNLKIPDPCPPRTIV